MSPLGKTSGRGLAPVVRRIQRSLSLYNLSAVLNPIFDLSAGGARRPVFHDIDKTCPQLRTLDAACDVIQADAASVLSAYGRLPSYHAIDTDVIHSSGRERRDKRWSVFMLTCFGKEPQAAPVHAPRTLAMVQKIPGLYQAMFSILEPGKNVSAHAGPSRAYLRYHLGLMIPTIDPPSLRVKDQLYTWKNGDSVLFDDSWNHEVINESPQMRVILIVDIRRPMPFALTGVARGMEVVARRRYAPRVVNSMNALLTAPEST